MDKNDSNNYLDIAELQGDTIDDDLIKRDFTMNAIAIELKRDGSLGTMIDPLGGAQDIKKKLIKKVDQDSFVSDPLRILRAFRFAAALSFEIEISTIEEIRNRAMLLSEVSAERILAELIRILKTSQSVFYFRQLDQLGILEVIFPEIHPMKGCHQNSMHHKDVWEHSLLVMENCENILNNLPLYFKQWNHEVAINLGENNRLPLLKLAALFHDIGKPGARGINQDTGNITFYDHDVQGARLVENISID